MVDPVSSEKYAIRLLRLGFVSIDYRWWFILLPTQHHEPQKWKARRQFRYFDLSLLRCFESDTPRGRRWWRLWVYWKDKGGVIYGRHIDWCWFPKRSLTT